MFPQSRIRHEEFSFLQQKPNNTIENNLIEE